MLVYVRRVDVDCFQSKEEQVSAHIFCLHAQTQPELVQTASESVLKYDGVTKQGVTRRAFVLSKALSAVSCRSAFFLLPTCFWGTGGCYSIVVC